MICVFNGRIVDGNFFVIVLVDVYGDVVVDVIGK